MKQKPIHGGARKGAGRKPSGIETVTISFRVPKTKAQTIITHIKKYLKKFEVKK